jgi:TetR/AcrR family transcriptional repressor of nem operon
VRAAAEAWHSRSFDGVGVAEICRLAKVNKGSFFHFFASKEALLLAVIEHHSDCIRERLMSGPFRRDVPPLARLERYFHERRAALRDQRSRTGSFRGCPIGNLVSELGTRDEAARDAAARVLDLIRQCIADVLREAAADGSLSADVDVELAAGAIVTYMQGLAVLGKAYRDPARIDRLGELIPVLIGARSVPKRRKARAPRLPR